MSVYRRQIYQIAESNRNFFCPNWNALASAHCPVNAAAAAVDADARDTRKGTRIYNCVSPLIPSVVAWAAGGVAFSACSSACACGRARPTDLMPTSTGWAKKWGHRLMATILSIWTDFKIFSVEDSLVNCDFFKSVNIWQSYKQEHDFSCTFFVF